MIFAKHINAALAFILELGLLAALAYWGFHTSDQTALAYGLGLGAPLLAIAAWGTYAAPRSARRLKQPWRFVFAVLLFSMGAIALYSAGQHGWALILAATAVVNQGLILLWKQ